MKKKLAIMIAMIVATLLLSSCSATDQFETHIKSGDYTRAIAEYQKNIQGNSEKEAIAEKFAADYLDNCISEYANGTKDEASTNAAIDCLMEVDNETGILVLRLMPALNWMSDLRLSKENFALANAYMEQAEYKLAIDACLGVHEDDIENYTAAQELLVSAKSALQKDFISKIDALMADGSYSDAIILYEGEDYIDKSAPELSNRIVSCKIGYREEIIDLAISSYYAGSPMDSLLYVDEGLKLIPDDHQLNSLYELLSSAIPDTWDEIKYDKFRNGVLLGRTEVTDYYGEEHTGNLLGFSPFWMDKHTYVEIVANQKYTDLSATIFAGDFRTIDTVQLKILCDGVCIYDSGRLSRTFQAQPLQLDITNAAVVRIEVINDYGEGAVWLQNLTFQKSLSDKDFNAALG